jgi:hypothetical protein
MICIGTICDGSAERGRKKFRRVLALGLLAAAISPLAGQIVLPLPYPAPPGLPAGLPGPGNQNGDQNAETRKLQQRMEKARNEKRQRELVRDTNALLDLARRLDAQIRGSTGESLTPEQIKLTAEIEKLAKSVETKMKGP